MECFCGCGREVPLRLRSVNRYGKVINHQGAIVKVLLARGMQSPNAERFLREATAHCRTCADAVHGGEKLPKPEVEELERYSRFAQVRFGQKAIHYEVRRSRRTSQEAMAEIEAGRFDPYPDIEFPTPDAQPPPKKPLRDEFAPPARPPSWREVHEDPT